MKNDTESSDLFLEKFARLMRLTLYNSLEDSVSIKDEIEALSLYMDMEKLRSNNKFDYSFIIDEKLDVNYYRIPSKVDILNPQI